MSEIYGLKQKDKIRLHPYMKELITDYIKKTKNYIDRNGGPGLHAEIIAVNDVFNELSRRGIDPKTYDLSKIEVATYLVKGMKIDGKRFERCANCKGILGSRFLILTDLN